MSLQFSTAVRNALLDAIESAIGVSAVLKIFSGAAPANCAAADSGTVLATLALPADWMADASGGTKTKAGSWADASADAGAPTNAGHFRLYGSDGVTCHAQGTITATGGGGDMTLDSVAITAGQAIVISGFTLTAPGA